MKAKLVAVINKMREAQLELENLAIKAQSLEPPAPGLSVNLERIAGELRAILVRAHGIAVKLHVPRAE